MFSVQIEDKGFTEAIAKAAGLSDKDFQPELGRLGDTLLMEISGEFTGERDPYGNKWAPLKPVTIEVKKEHGSRTPSAILQDTGTLARSFHWQLVPGGLSIYTERSFPDGVTAEIHQLGGTHPRSNAFIPPREMLPFRDQLPVDWLSWIEAFHDIGIDRLFR